MPAFSPDSSVRPFPAVMRLIHWATALLMALVVVLAWIAPEHQPPEGTLVMLHKTVGIAILALTVLRLGLRTLTKVPPEPAGTSRVEAAAARAGVWLLYGIMFAMPVSGYLSEAARGRGVDMLGLFTIPPLLPAWPLLHQAAWSLHSAGQLAVYTVVGLHIAAAAYHLLVRRDAVMQRMWPGASRLMPPGAARPAVR